MSHPSSINQRIRDWFPTERLSMKTAPHEWKDGVYAFGFFVFSKLIFSRLSQPLQLYIIAKVLEIWALF